MGETSLMELLRQQHEPHAAGDVPWYVIEAKPWHGIRSLRMQTARHYLTDRVGPGDTVAAVLRVSAGRERLRVDVRQHQDRLVNGEWEADVAWNAAVSSTLGRAVALGEDTADAAFGATAADLIFERLYEWAEWRMAPVCYTEDLCPLDDPARRNDDDAYDAWCERSRLEVRARLLWRCEVPGGTSRGYATVEELVAGERLAAAVGADAYDPTRKWVRLTDAGGETVRVYCDFARAD